MAYLPRTVMTGHGAVAITRSATLPRKNFEKPRRPCVPTTMRSARLERAVRTISCAGSPVTIIAAARTPRFLAFSTSFST